MLVTIVFSSPSITHFQIILCVLRVLSIWGSLKKMWFVKELIFQRFAEPQVAKSVTCGVLILYHTIPTFNDPKEEGIGKH